VQLAAKWKISSQGVLGCGAM